MRKLRKKKIEWGLRFRYPSCRLDWISPNKIMLTSPQGRRIIISCGPEPWSWESLVTWLIPMIIWMWGMGMMIIGLWISWKG